MKDMLTIEDAATQLGVTRSNLYHGIRRGVIKTNKFGSQHVIYQKEIDRYRRENLREKQ